MTYIPDPLYVSCHTCHADVGQPCRWATWEHAYHLVRIQRASSTLHHGIDVMHGLAHGNECKDSYIPGICDLCGLRIERLKSIPETITEVHSKHEQSLIDKKEKERKPRKKDNLS